MRKRQELSQGKTCVVLVIAKLFFHFFGNVDFFYHESASQTLRANIDSARAAVAKVRLDLVKVRKPDMPCMMVSLAHSVSVLRAFAANVAPSHNILPAFNSI